MKSKILAVATFSILAFNANAYVVGGASSALTSSSSSWSWDGSYLKGFRDALENPDFFGPSGVVNESITTTNLSTVTETTLSTIDMFVAPWVADSQAATFGSNVIDFFLGGGDLFLLQDDSGHDYLGELLGLATTSSNGSVSNGGFPFFDGPFGSATDVTQHYLTGKLDPLAVENKNGTIVGTNLAGEVTSAYWSRGSYKPGSGALFIIADVDMIASTPPNGAIYGSELADLNDNAIYALNTFSFLKNGETVIEKPPIAVPEPSTFVLLGLGLAVLGFRQRKKT